MKTPAKKPEAPWTLVHHAGRFAIECRRHRIDPIIYRPLERLVESFDAISDSHRLPVVARECLDELARLRMLPGPVATAADRLRAALPLNRPR